LVRLLLSRFPRWPPPGAQDWDEDLERINTALALAFLRQATLDGTDPMVVYLPARNDLQGHSGATKDIVLDAVKGAGGTALDLTSCIQAIGVDRAFIDERPHYSREGNAAVARCLLPLVFDRLKHR
jgi:hypothetical protein